jgi:hypothetical protein
MGVDRKPKLDEDGTLYANETTPRESEMTELPSVGNRVQRSENTQKLFLELQIRCPIQLSYEREY